MKGGEFRRISVARPQGLHLVSKGVSVVAGGGAGNGTQGLAFQCLVDALHDQGLEYRDVQARLSEVFFHHPDPGGGQVAGKDGAEVQGTSRFGSERKSPGCQ